MFHSFWFEYADVVKDLNILFYIFPHQTRNRISTYLTTLCKNTSIKCLDYFNIVIFISLLVLFILQRSISIIKLASWKTSFYNTIMEEDTVLNPCLTVIRNTHLTIIWTISLRIKTLTLLRSRKVLLLTLGT